MHKTKMTFSRGAFLFLILLQPSMEQLHPDLSTLKLVQIIYRHGDRDPDRFENGVPKLVGSLTALGKQEMYKLGTTIRNMYDHFIGQDFDSTKVSIISSDTDRTIASAQVLAYGLYKDFNLRAHWNLKEKIQYEPIPIHTIPKEMDRVLQVTADCPRREELWAQSQEETAARFQVNHSDLLEYYDDNNQDGFNMATDRIDSATFNRFIIHQEQLIFNSTHNLPIPDWTRRLLQDETFLNLKALDVGDAMSKPEFARLHSGPLVQNVMDHFEARLRDPDNKRKMILYSGHDKSVYGLLLTLDLLQVHESSMPVNGAALFIELHQKSTVQADWERINGVEHHLKFWYRNDTSSRPYLIESPSCGQPCTLTSLQKLTQKVVPVDYDLECGHEVSVVV